MKTKHTIHFLGASGTVTGSKYLLEIGEKKIMIDCGLFQGLKKLRELNWSYLPFHAKDIDAVLLTHGHLDHVGFLPRLVKMGFTGPIYSTVPSLSIAKIILSDSGRIQEEDAKRANEEGYSKHSPAVPLYNLEEAEKTFEFMQPLPEGEWLPLFDDIEVRFQHVSHILGATFIEINADGKRYVFSGDVGRKNDRLLYEPKKPEKADVLLIETTYGDRIHPADDAMERLTEIITSTVARGGSLFIPSFAVERTQTLMYMLWELKKQQLIPEIPMIMDSPMGDHVLEVFKNNSDWYRKDPAEIKEMMDAFRIVKSYKETWEVIDQKTPKIVIAGSGMVTGGRILTYLQYYLDKPETSVILVGYQAEGTRGRALLEGYPEIKLRGKFIPVKAEIHSIESLSSHADQAELLDWISELTKAPEHVFLIHGENQARDTFRMKLENEKGWKVELPEMFDIVEL
jgi:metallo-beta-lactamase family protein